ncbi:class II aldolase/adducin family protein [bacterium]|nr:class II aldolase/adducin family protein [bacterium]MBP3847818.1 class II aldolase/adducin family protein [bacterium]
MFEDIKNDIISFGRIAGNRNLTPGISGNISVRCDDKIIITTSGSANSFLNNEDICVIDFAGNLIEGSKKASSEKFLHIEFYKKRPDIGAICHFHSPYLTSFAASGIAITEKVLPEIVFMFGEIPLAEYALPGSKLLVEETAKYFDNYKVVLMKNHGVISGGETLKDAYLNIELCETYAQTLVLSKILGGAKILSDNQVEEIDSLR